jgi:ATP-dependent DNA helicase RecG
MNFLETPIEKLKGIGAVRAKQLGKLGIFCIKDLIYYFPRGYERRGDVKLISESALDVPTASILTVGTAVRTAKIKNGLSISKFRAFDDSGAVEVVFFNSPFVKDVFTLGASFRFFGKFSYSKSGLQLLNPKYEPIIESKPLDDFVPVYPLTEGISSKIIDKLILSVIDEALFYIKDH